MNNKQKKALWWMSSILVIILLAILGTTLYKQFEEKKEEEKEPTHISQANKNAVYFNGEPYVYNTNIKNILFLGVDNDKEITLQNQIGKSGQADTIIIVSIDKEKKTTELMQISRNAMTEVDLYDKNGNYYSSINAQIATQYAYGNGANTSCWAMKRTVSELLQDLPISGYFALDIAAVTIANDMLGGVTITIPEDYTEIDPAFQKGATITLNGEQAEKYVRYRNLSETGSNNERMQRQAQYISALLDTFQAKEGYTDEKLEALYDAIASYAVTDLSAEEMKELLNTQWNTDEVTYLPGETKQGEEYEEFHVNQEKLKEILIKRFYKQK